MIIWLDGDLGLKDLANVVLCYFSSTGATFAILLITSDFCQPGLNDVISDEVDEDDLAFHC